MLVLLSPAKKLNTENPLLFNSAYTPALFTDAVKINAALKKLSAKKLMALQKISNELALQNHLRNQQWNTQQTEKVYYTAINMFNGDAYLGLDADTLTAADMDYAQNHLRILSGLYGILKPLDLIEPYRLEMGTKIKIGRAENLYKYWQTKITMQIADQFKSQPIINLASAEYSRAIDFKALPNNLINVSFKDQNAKGEHKVMSYYAKRARGLMARYILQNKISDPQKLTTFCSEDYYFDAENSTTNNLLFLRDH